MNSELHQKLWTKSIDRCLAALEKRRVTAMAEYNALAANAKDPFDVFAADDLPEKYDDPIGDALCRLTPPVIARAAEYGRNFLEDLRDDTRHMGPEEAQNYLLSALRDELREHMFRGVPRENLNLIFMAMVELESQFGALAQKQAPHSGNYHRQLFFEPITQYANLAEGSLDYLSEMLADRQNEQEIDEQEHETGLFQLAERELQREGKLKKSGAMNDEDMSEEEIDACCAQAGEIYEDVLDLYDRALPSQYCAELPWFVGSLKEHYLRQPRMMATQLPVAHNDNESNAYDRIMEKLSRTFLHNTDTFKNVRSVLDAQLDVQQVLDQHKGHATQVQRH